MNRKRLLAFISKLAGTERTDFAVDQLEKFELLDHEAKDLTSGQLGRILFFTAVTDGSPESFVKALTSNPRKKIDFLTELFTSLGEVGVNDIFELDKLQISLPGVLAHYPQQTTLVGESPAAWECFELSGDQVRELFRLQF